MLGCAGFAAIILVQIPCPKRNEDSHCLYSCHPETEALVHRIIYGQTHSPYTEKGKKSVDWVKAELGSEKISAIYSSPMERTRTLAEAIASAHRGISVQPDERIKEMAVGIFEQMSVTDAEAAHPEHLRPFLDDFGNYRAPGSELFPRSPCVRFSQSHPQGDSRKGEYP